MKVIRIILVLIGLLLLIFVGVGLFGPTSMEVTHKKVVKAPMASVWEQVVDFKNWPNWSPWAESDTAMVVTYGEKGSRGVGGSYSWEGPVTGVGEMEIREITENEEIGMDIGFDMGEGMTYSTADMQFKEVEGGTEITWNFNSSGQEDFMERIFNVIMPSVLKGMYDTGLTNLEQAALENPYKPKKEVPMEVGVREMEKEGFWYIGDRYTDVTMSDVGQAEYGASYQKIFAHLGATGNADKIIQPPMSVTHAYDTETTITTFSVAMKTSQEVDPGTDLECVYIEPHKALVYMHVGDYEGISKSYEKAVQVMLAKGYTMKLPSYEVYITDPGTEPDSSKWKTELVIPVENN